jgi:hypothetical protein
MTRALVNFTTNWGFSVSVETTSDTYLETLRTYGRRRWFSGDVPPKGFRFPYDNEHDFDWALLGGRLFVNEQKETCVSCRGHVWKRRVVPATKTKHYTFPETIKYSRGAKQGDPPEVQETGDGEIAYVTLVRFMGGERCEELAVPAKGASSPPARPAPAHTSPDRLLTADEASDLIAELVKLRHRPPQQFQMVAAVLGKSINLMTELSLSDRDQLLSYAQRVTEPSTTRRSCNPRMPNESIHNDEGAGPEVFDA